MKKIFLLTRWLSLIACLLFGLLHNPSAAQVQTIASGLTNPISIVVDDTYVYWTEGLFDNYVKWTNKGGGRIDLLLPSGQPRFSQPQPRSRWIIRLF